MMEPQQEFFRTGCRIIKLRPKTFMILTYCVAAFFCAVKPDPTRICLVIIRWRPVGSHAFWRPPGTGAIVTNGRHDMMEPERHHKVHGGFPAFEHHLFYGKQKILLPAGC